MTWWISLRSRSFSIWMSRMILCESSAGWSTVAFSKFSVIDERNGVSCGSKNTSYVESQVDKSAFAVVSVFCGVFPLDWTSSRWRLPFYWGSLLPVKYRRNCCWFLSPFTPRKWRKIIRWLEKSRANSCVLCHLEMFAYISSNSDDPFHK